MQYAHRLPADYDMSRIEDRARGRGPLWDATAGLGFKAFAARRIAAGAADNVYTSIYLWRDPAAALAFLQDDRFAAVVNTFGRPQIRTWQPLDVTISAQQDAAPTSIVRSEIDIGQRTTIAAVHAEEVERNARAIETGALVAVSALDLERWRLVNFTLFSKPVANQADTTAYEILHLARPGWDALAQPRRMADQAA